MVNPIPWVCKTIGQQTSQNVLSGASPPNPKVGERVYCTLIPPTLGFGGGSPDKKIWDVCWPTVLQTRGIGLTVVFSHGISPIKENIVT